MPELIRVGSEALFSEYASNEGSIAPAWGGDEWRRHGRTLGQLQERSASIQGVARLEINNRHIHSSGGNVGRELIHVGTKNDQSPVGEFGRKHGAVRLPFDPL